MKKFKAIIFDMDGVIADSEPFHERAFLEVFEALGHGQNHGFHFPDYYGRADEELWLDFIARHQSPRPLEELASWKHDCFLRLIKDEQPIFPELPGLVERLAAHYSLAVASGSLHPVIDEILSMKNLRRFFRAVVSVQDVARGKPAPDIFLRAAELLGVSPPACCVVEDSAAGVAAALAAGMTVVAITNSLPAEKLNRASHLVRNYGELEKILLSEME